MKSPDENWLHDLRSPLARALTLAKLLRDAGPDDKDECLALLLQALEEMDQRLSSLPDPR